MIKKVNIIGAGNMARYLVHRLNPHLEISGIYSRNVENAKALALKINASAFDELDQLSADVDLNIVCVSDDAISEVASWLPFEIPIVHTSGSVSVEVFEKFKVFGCFYPLQSISKGRVDSIENIPIIIECNDQGFLKNLKDFAISHFSQDVRELSSEQRRVVHLAAVFTNNFVNHILTLSDKILNDKGIEKDVLHSLLKETIDKAIDLGAENSQTGPAKRRDQKTIEDHLSLIDDPALKKIYSAITESIQSANS